VACRRVLLCAGIATALASWTGASSASPVNGADASASPADASASGGYADFDRSLLSGAGQNTTDLVPLRTRQPGAARQLQHGHLSQQYLGRPQRRAFRCRFGKSSATPCVDRQLLDQLGLHPDKLSAELVAN
jgi:outer membrane usher protein